MSLILNIETATEVCSASLTKNGELLALREDLQGQMHGKILTVFIVELFRESGLSVKQLDAVAVSMGPGSYTGLRIGVSVAKGIAYAGNLPLIALSTLQAMALGACEQINPDNQDWLCPMIDARRMEVYTALYDIKNQLLQNISAEIIDENSFGKILKERKIIFLGNGAGKCRQFIKSPNAVFVDDFYCSAKYMSKLSFDAFMKNEFVDTAYFEPYYLKDFIATIPGKGVLAQNIQ